jgi:hypothetical protein
MELQVKKTFADIIAVQKIGENVCFGNVDFVIYEGQ